MVNRLIRVLLAEDSPTVRYHLQRMINDSPGLQVIGEARNGQEALELAEKLKPDFQDYDIRVSILGHLQRGGSPSALDRVNASRLGHAAIEALLDDQKSVMVGLQNDEIVLVPFRKAVKLHKDVNRSLVAIIDVLNV